MQVAREMKTLGDKDGQSTIKPDEWKTVQQISNLFSSQTAVQRRGVDAEKIPEEGIEAAESEVALGTLSDELLVQIKPSNHSGRQQSLRTSVVKTNTFGSLKLAFLKKICEKLHQTTTGPLSRKKTFIDAIKAFSES